MTINIKKYNNDLKNLSYLIDESFWIQLINKTKLVEWKFMQNINHKKNKIFCAYEDERIIGQYSNISHIFSFKNFLLEWYLCQDMCVLKEYRWQGLISQMSKKLYSNIKEQTFTIWFSNNLWIKVDKNSKWYWYNIIDNMKWYYFPTFLSKKWYEFEKIYNFKSLDVIDFSKLNIFSNFIKINQNKNFIKWRYFDNPNIKKYDIFLVKENSEIIWYCIFSKNSKSYNLLTFDTCKNIDRIKLINTFKSIAINEKYYLLSIILLENIFWNNFLKWIIKINKKIDTYFTIKNHNDFSELWKKSNLNKENWIILSRDIL